MWAKKQPRRLLWLRLSRLDNSRDRFFMRFTGAAQREFPALAQALGDMCFPRSTQEYDTLLQLLEGELAQGGGALFILDDYEAITDPIIREFVKTIVAARLEQLCIVLLSNRKEDYNVSGLKNGRLVFPVTEKELRFTKEEAGVLFAQAGMTVPEQELEELLVDTDGWPLALYMLALQCRKRQEQPRMMRFLPLAAELFEYEYYLLYPQGIRTLLVQLSAFPFFTVDMVRALDCGDLSAAIHAISHNSFIFYEYEEGRFSLQSVYHRFLKQKLQLLDVQERARVYALGGRWMMQLEQLYDAVVCFFHAGAYDEMVKAIWEIPRKHKTTVFSEFVLDYLERVPASYRSAHPSVDLAMGYHYMNIFEYARARRLLLGIVKPRRVLRSLPREFLGEVYFALGDACLICNDLAFAEYYRRACACLPLGSSIRDEGMCFVASTTIFLPDTRTGQLEAVVQAVADVWPAVDAASHSGGHGFACLFAAEAAYATCDLGKAERLARRAVYKAMETGQELIACNGLYLLMRIACCKGDYVQCEAQIASLRSYADHAAHTAARDALHMAENWYYIRLGDLGKVVNRALEHTGRAGERSRYTLRHSLCHARYLMAKRAHHEALAYLEYIEKLAEGWPEKWLARLYTHVMKAVCYLKQKESALAVQSLWNAYALSHENGILAPFVEQGNAMRALVNAARAQHTFCFQEEWLDAVYQKGSIYAKRFAMVVEEYRIAHHIRPQQGIALSGREQDVLRMLAQGLTRQEIGASCNISVHGVKKHITSIYGKLGAVNRADAIQIANTRGML